MAAPPQRRNPCVSILDNQVRREKGERTQISLNGTWQLKGTASYVPLRDKSMETGKPLEGVTGWMDAQVPGGVARALYQAGYIDHPYVDMNSLKCE